MSPIKQYNEEFKEFDAIEQKKLNKALGFIKQKGSVIERARNKLMNKLKDNETDTSRKRKSIAIVLD